MKNSDAFKMPKVGDRLMRTMSHFTFGTSDGKPEPCIVVYVSEPKYYYTVQFVDSGLKESYKVPHANELQRFKDDYYKFFKKKAKGVYVYESGELYSSISECAKAIGVLPCTVSKHIHGLTSNVKGYHIYMLN